MSMYEEARRHLLDAFSEIGEKGLFLYEIYELLEERGVTDKRISSKALNELYNMGLIGYGVIPDIDERELENPLNPPCNYYSIDCATKREPIRAVCSINPY